MISESPGFSLNAGGTLTTDNHTLILQPDCSLDVTNAKQQLVWSSNTGSQQCSSPVLTYLPTGELTITGTVAGASGATVWSAGVAGTTKLTLTDTMPWFELRNADGSMAWSVMHRLSDVAPAMAAAIGFNDPSYANAVMASSPVTAAAGDDSDQFMAPNGQVVTVTVKNPVATRTYDAPAIAKGQDPAAYFQAQLAKAGNGVTIVIPKAVYNFAPIDCTNSSDPNYRPAGILIPRSQDVVLDGQGSTLNFNSDCVGIDIYQAARFAFKNFIINFPSWESAVVGQIAAYKPDSNGGTFSLQVPTTNMIGHVGVVTAWDTKANSWSLTAPHSEIYFPTNYQPSANGMVTNLPAYGQKFVVGQSYLARDLTGTANAITVYDSQDVTLDHVTIYNAPDLAMLILFGRGLHIENSAVTRTGSNPISSVADAVHFGSFGGDVIIENNFFGYQGDDGLNIHTDMVPLGATPSCGSSSSNCPVTLPQGFGASDGDIIALFDTTTKYIDKQTANCSGDSCTVNAAAIANGGYVADLTLGSARYIIRRNTFADNRARGALLQAPYGLVQGNKFISQSLFSLYFVVSSYWQEGAGAQNVLVMNNLIQSPGNGGGNGAITVAAENSNGIIYDASQGQNAAPPVPGTNQNLIFAHNTLSQLPGAAFFLSSTNDVVLDGNTLQDTNKIKSGNLYGVAALNSNYATVVGDASNVLLSQNILSGKSTSGLLTYDSNTTTGLATQ